MARMIKSKHALSVEACVSTKFTDGHKTTRKLSVGDIIEGLRYVLDGEIETVSGKITAINYTLNSRLTWDKNRPTNSIIKDMTLDTVVVDSSDEFESKIVTIPFREILEDEGVEDVERMLYEPNLVLELWLYFSNRSSQHALIEVGDTFDNVRIMNPLKIGTDYTGSYRVIGFAYKSVNKKLDVTGVAFQNIEDGSVVVTDIGYIFGLNEVYTFDVKTTEELAKAVADFKDGDSLKIASDVDITGSALVLDGKSGSIDLDGKTITANGGKDGSIFLSHGKIAINDTGKDGGIVCNTPFDKEHGTGFLVVREGGDVTINSLKATAVVGDTVEEIVDKGQFAIVVNDDAQLTINNADVTAGWYAICGNGSATNEKAVTTINGGNFKSVADYCIYHPHKGTLIINDGKFYGAAGCISANAGKIYIHGGTFTCTADGNVGEWPDGTSGQDNAIINCNAKYADTEIYIDGGEFTTKENAPIIVNKDSGHLAKIVITGGRFSARPDEELIGAGYAVSTTKDEDGFYFVYSKE